VKNAAGAAAVVISKNQSAGQVTIAATYFSALFVLSCNSYRWKKILHV